jgi:hypothetical protein
MQIDAEAGGKALFDVTWNGTLFATWEDQPVAFRDDLRRKAEIVATAALVDDDPSPYQGADHD